MSITDISQTISLCNSINSGIHNRQKEQQLKAEETKSLKSPTAKEYSRSSDSGKSSSCSPILLDCSFDSGIAGVLLESNDMQLHKRIQQCQCILLALERDRDYFFTIRNRLSKITNRKKKSTNENEFFCNVCCAEIDPEDEKTFIKCYICQKYICRSIKCADWLPKSAQWECELCHSSKESLAQTSSWVADQITFHQEKLIHPPRARSEIYIPISECNDSSIHFESVSQIGANSTAITAEQKLKIREYVEEVVAKLLGGNLDTIAVNQLSKSENYLSDPKGENSYNGRMSRESVPVRSNGHDFTDISETRLRQMIQKIIAETMSLPPLSNGHAVSEISLDRRSKAADNRVLSNGYHQRHRTEHYFEPTIYQDLLATAVLNKIVDKKLNNNHGVSETDIVGGDGVGEDDDNGVKNIISLAECDQNLNTEKLSTTSGSSVEPRSDCSYPEIEQILNTNDDKSSEILRNSDRDSVISDYLASHLIPLPDLNAMATESDEDDYMSVTSSAVGDGTWEKNWLFKKKKTTLSGSVTANSVGMLVPDPKEDVRAQIGDKTTDEISDLSELGSDSDDSLDSLRSNLEPINDRLINKHLIGGQNNKMILDELIERSSMISNTLPNSQDPSYTDACNEHVIDAPTKNEAINDNVTQQTNKMEQKVSLVLQDPNSNTLTASDDSNESIGCIGFSAIEIIEPSPDTPSVVEILAAMALGPMLAVPSGDQPATLTVSDYNAFIDLKELALAEIKARALELTPRNLDVIPEETGDVTNQMENLIDSIELNSLINQEIKDSKIETFVIKNNLNSNEISFTISEPKTSVNKVANIELTEDLDVKDITTNEDVTNLSILKSTKFDSEGNSHLGIDENTVTEELTQTMPQEQASINEGAVSSTNIETGLANSEANSGDSEQTTNKSPCETNTLTNIKNETFSVIENSQQIDIIIDQPSSEIQLQHNSDVMYNYTESGCSLFSERLFTEQPSEIQPEVNEIIEQLKDKSNSTNNQALSLCLEQSVQNLSDEKSTVVKEKISIEPQPEPNKTISNEQFSEVPQQNISNSPFEIPLNDTKDDKIGETLLYPNEIISQEKLFEKPQEYKSDFAKHENLSIFQKPVIESKTEEASTSVETILKQEAIEKKQEINEAATNEKSSDILLKDISDSTYNKASSFSTKSSEQPKTEENPSNETIIEEQFYDAQTWDTTDSISERNIEYKTKRNTSTGQPAVVDEQISKEEHSETHAEGTLNSMSNKTSSTCPENSLQFRNEEGTPYQQSTIVDDKISNDHPFEAQPEDSAESTNNEVLSVEKLLILDKTISKEQPNETQKEDILDSIKNEDISVCPEHSVESKTENSTSSAQSVIDDEEISKYKNLGIHPDSTSNSTNNKALSTDSELSIEESTSHITSIDSKEQSTETIPEDISDSAKNEAPCDEQPFQTQSKDYTKNEVSAFLEYSTQPKTEDCASEAQPSDTSNSMNNALKSACSDRIVESKTEESTLSGQSEVVKEQNLKKMQLETQTEVCEASLAFIELESPTIIIKSISDEQSNAASEQISKEQPSETQSERISDSTNNEAEHSEHYETERITSVQEHSLESTTENCPSVMQSTVNNGTVSEEQLKIVDETISKAQKLEIQSEANSDYIRTDGASDSKTEESTSAEQSTLKVKQISKEQHSEIQAKGISDYTTNEALSVFSDPNLQNKNEKITLSEKSTFVQEQHSKEHNFETQPENTLDSMKNEISLACAEHRVKSSNVCPSVEQSTISKEKLKVNEKNSKDQYSENQTEGASASAKTQDSSESPARSVESKTEESTSAVDIQNSNEKNSKTSPESISDLINNKYSSVLLDHIIQSKIENSSACPECSEESNSEKSPSTEYVAVVVEKNSVEKQPETQPDVPSNFTSEVSFTYSKQHPEKEFNETVNCKETSLTSLDPSTQFKTDEESALDEQSKVVDKSFSIDQPFETLQESTTELLSNSEHNSIEKQSEAKPERNAQCNTEKYISGEQLKVIDEQISKKQSSEAQRESISDSTNDEASPDFSKPIDQYKVDETSSDAQSTVVHETISEEMHCETKPDEVFLICPKHRMESIIEKNTTAEQNTVEKQSKTLPAVPSDSTNEVPLAFPELGIQSKTKCSSDQLEVFNKTITKGQPSETGADDTLDSTKNENFPACPKYCVESKTEEHNTAEHLALVVEKIRNEHPYETELVVEKITNEQLPVNQPKNSLHSIKNEDSSACPVHGVESKTEKCTSAQQSTVVAKDITSRHLPETQQEDTLDSIRKESSSACPEHSVESKNEKCISTQYSAAVEEITNEHPSETQSENTLDSTKNENKLACPERSVEPKTEECTSDDPSAVIVVQLTNEHLYEIQQGNTLDSVKNTDTPACLEHRVESKTEECTSAEYSTVVVEQTTNDQPSEYQQEKILNSMRNEDTLACPEHNVESKTEKCTSAEHLTVVVEQITNKQPFETQNNNTLNVTKNEDYSECPECSMESKTEECTSAEHSAVVVKQIMFNVQLSETQPENTLDSMKNEDSSACPERSVESKTDPSAAVVEPIISELPSEIQSENTVDTMKNNGCSSCPERNMEYKIEECNSSEHLELVVDQSENTLDFMKNEDTLACPEHSVESKTEECTSAEHSAAVVEQITNEQHPEETQPENTLDYMKKQNFSACPEHNVKSKTQECSSTEHSTVVVEQIANEQLSENEPANTLDPMKNEDYSACLERSMEFKHEECTPPDGTAVVVEQITNIQPSEVQPENTLDSMKNEDSLAFLERSVEFKTEECTSVDPSAVVVQQIRSEQPSDIQPENALDSIRNEDSLQCPERIVESKTEEQSAVVFDQPENTLESMKNEDTSGCPEQSVEYKFEECTLAERSTVVVEQITNEQSPEVQLTVEQITNEQHSETQSEDTLDSMKNENSSACPEHSAESKPEKCTSAEHSAVVVEQITIEQLPEEISNVQHFETQSEDTLDSMKNENSSACPEHSAEYKPEECSSTEYSTVVVEQIANEQPSENEPANTLDPMKNEDYSACLERSMEFKHEECTPPDGTAVVVEQITNIQPSEVQPENTLDSMKNEDTLTFLERSVEFKTGECTAVDPSAVVVEQIRSEKSSDIQPENTLDSTRNEDSLQWPECIVESKTEEQSAVVFDQPENTLESMKNEDTSGCPEHSVQYKPQQCTLAEHSTVVVEQITNEQSPEVQLTVEQITNEQHSETQSEDTLDSMKNENSSACPEHSAEYKPEECSSTEHSTVVVEQITNEKLPEEISNEQHHETQSENTLDSMKKQNSSPCPEHNVESKTEECSSTEHSTEVVEQIANEQPSENEAENTLDPMKNEDYSACLERSMEFKHEECTPPDPTAVVVEQIANIQPSEIQPENTLDSMKNEDSLAIPERSVEFKTKECTSVDRSAVVVERIRSEQPSDIQPENTLESMRNEDSSQCTERIVESKTEEQSAVVFDQPENTLDSMKNEDTSGCPEHSVEYKPEECTLAEHSEVVVEQITNEQHSQNQSEHTLDSMKNENSSACPEHSAESKTKKCTSAEHSATVVEQITNEKLPEEISNEQHHETQSENTLDSMKKQNSSPCPEYNVESKTEKCSSTEHSTEVVEQIANEQPSENEPENTSDPMKNEDYSACLERSMEFKHEECTPPDLTAVVVEQVTNIQPSEVQPKNTLDSMKNEDSLAFPERSVDFKTEECTSVDPSKVVVEQIRSEQPSDIQPENTLESMRNKDSSQCTERIVESKTEEQSAVVFDQPENTLDSMKNEDTSGCQEHSVEYKPEECTLAEHSAVVVEQITNEQSPEVQLTVEQITNEQHSENQSEHTLDSMKNENSSACPEHSAESKTEKCTSAEHSATVVEQITKLPEEISNEQHHETQPGNSLDSKQNSSPCPDHNVESKTEECSSTEHSTEVVEQIANEQPSENEPENTLDPMKNEDYSACLERSMEFKHEECTPPDLTAVVVEQVTNIQPSEVQPKNTLDSMKNEDSLAFPERSVDFKTEECTSVDPSKVVVEQIRSEQPSDIQPENTLESMRNKDSSLCTERIVESKTEEQSAVVFDQPENTLDSMKIEDTSGCPEHSVEYKPEECTLAEHSAVVVEQITNEQSPEVQLTVEQITNEQHSENQSEHTLDSMKNENSSACPEHSAESKTEKCTSAEHSATVAEQITKLPEEISNEQHRETQPENSLDSKQNSSPCPEHNVESKTEECSSTEHSTVVVDQPSENEPENTLHPMKNEDFSACLERSTESKHEECTATDPSAVVVEQITNVPPSEVQPENTLDSMKNEAFPERSVEFKTEECTAVDPSAVVVEQIISEQPSDIQPENTLDSIRNEDSSQCPERIVESKTEEQSAVVFDQPENTLESMKNEDTSGCPEHSVEYKPEECTLAEHSTAVVEQISNGQSPEVQLTVEQITNEQHSETQSEDTLDSMKNENTSARPEHSAESKPEKCTSAEHSAAVVEQITNGKLPEEISNEQHHETQPENSLDSKQNSSPCPEHNVESKTEERSSTEHSTVVVDQPSENEPESTLHPMKNEDFSACLERSMEFKHEECTATDPSAVVVEQITNVQSSEVQPENSLDSMKNEDFLAFPERSVEFRTEECTAVDPSAAVVEQIRSEQPSDIQPENTLESMRNENSSQYTERIVESKTEEQSAVVFSQPKSTLYSMKNEDTSGCPEHSVEYKPEECTLAEHLEVVVEQITNEQSPEVQLTVEQITNEQHSENQSEHTLDSMKNENSSACLEHSAESITEKCTSAEHSATVVEQIMNAQPSETERSMQSKTEQPTSAYPSKVVDAQITNDQPETQPEGTLDFMKNEDTSACPEHSVELKTEEGTSAKHSTLDFEHITNEQAFKTQPEDTSESMKNEDLSACYERIMESKIKRAEESKVVDETIFKDQPPKTHPQSISDGTLESKIEESTSAEQQNFKEQNFEGPLDSRNDEASAVCPELSMEFRIEESAFNDESALVNEKISEEQSSKTQSLDVSDFMDNEHSSIFSQPNAQSKTEKNTSVEQLTFYGTISKDQLFKIHPEGTSDPTKSEDYSEHTADSKIENYPTVEQSAEINGTITEEQPSEAQSEDTSYSTKNEDLPKCPEYIVESKIEDYPIAVIHEAITEKQLSEPQSEDTSYSTKNKPSSNITEPYLESITKESTEDNPSIVLIEEISKEEPSETKLEVNLESINCEESSALSDTSTLSKTEYALEKPSKLVNEQNSEEEYYEAQSEGMSNSTAYAKSSETKAEESTSAEPLKALEETISKKRHPEGTSDYINVETWSNHDPDMQSETKASTPVCLQQKLQSRTDECPLKKQTTVDDKTISEELAFTKISTQGTSDFLESNMGYKSEEGSSAEQSEAVDEQNSTEHSSKIQPQSTIDYNEALLKSNTEESISDKLLTLLDNAISEVTTHNSSINETLLDCVQPIALPKIEESTLAEHSAVADLTTSKKHQFKIDIEPNEVIPKNLLPELPLEGISDLMNIKASKVSSESRGQSKIKESISDKESTVCDETIKQPSKNEPKLNEIILKEQSSDVLAGYTLDSAGCVQPKIKQSASDKPLTVFDERMSKIKTEIALEFISDCTNNDTSLACQKSSGQSKAKNSDSLPDATNPKEQGFETQLEPNEIFPKEKSFETSDSIMTSTTKENVPNEQRTESDEIISNDQPFETQAKNNKEITNEQSPEIPLEDFSDSTNHEVSIVSSELSMQSKSVQVVSDEQPYNAVEMPSKMVPEPIETISEYNIDYSIKEASAFFSETNAQFKNEPPTVLVEIISKDPIYELQLEPNETRPKEQLFDISQVTILETSVSCKTDKGSSDKYTTMSDETISKEQNSESQTKDNETISDERPTLHDEAILKEQTFETRSEINKNISKVQSSQISFEALSDSTNSEASTTSSASSVQYKTEESTSVEQLAVLDETISKDQSSESQAEANKIISREVSSEKPIENISAESTNNKNVVESPSDISPTNRETCLESKTKNSNDSQNETNLCKKTENNLNPSEDLVLLDDTPSLSRQYTVVNIEGKDKRSEDTHNKVTDSSSAYEHNVTSGSIAEREYKKWYNAVEMPNNPYAPEALKRRISGSQERFIDLPNISPTKDLNPLGLLNTQNLDADENTTRESDYKRYSRDYYINSSLTTPQMSPARDVSANITKDNREVNNNNYSNINQNNNSYQNKSRNANTKHNPNDCHWTLSTPVRRSSSLKYLNKRISSPPPTHVHAPPTYHQHNRTSYILPTRPSTSTSYYNHFNQLHNDVNDDDEEDQLDLYSQRSWKSISSLNSKRRTVSMLSLFNSDGSRKSSNMTHNNHKDSNVLTQFEKQLLHKDLKRNSFRAVSATTKDFVLNPLYEKEQFFNGDKILKLSVVKPITQPEEHVGDMGVDSYLNVSNEFGDKLKQNDNILLF